MPAPASPFRSRTSRFLIAGVALLVAVLALWAWRRHAAQAAENTWRTAPVERGDIRVAISATGTLSAISTVDVGSQISGQVTEVLVDYNAHVSRGEVLARIDPSTYEAQIAQGTAAARSAQAGVAGAQAALRNAEADYARKAPLAGQQLIAKGDLDVARAARDQARAQVEATRAQIAQQVAATETARLNLQRTVIRSPVDGVVLTRSVEPGQTVAASLQAPVLFQIAEDLAQMQIVLAVDEADIGQVKPGQSVNFTVDAFPDRRYGGTVRQVRLSSTNTNNVITYPVVVAVRNDDGTLLPGMTANAEIAVSEHPNVLTVPNAALRFKPDEADIGNGGPSGTRTGSGIVDALHPIAAGLRLTPAQESAFEAAETAMRERAAARRAPAREAQGNALFGRVPGGPPREGATSGDSAVMRQRMQQRVGQQFGAFRNSLDANQRARWDAAVAALLNARRATLYRLVDGKPQPVLVRIGASDGSSTEVAGALHEGDLVIVGVQRPPPAGSTR